MWNYGPVSLSIIHNMNYGAYHQTSDIQSELRFPWRKLCFPSLAEYLEVHIFHILSFLTFLVDELEVFFLIVFLFF